MIRRQKPKWLPAALPLLLSMAGAALFLAFSLYGCKSHAHTSDSRLEKIDGMLNAQLPQGTPRSRLEFFLKSRGYKLEDSPDKSSLVAVVHLVDTDTLQPATARVTFHFDLNDRLVSYELQSAPDAPFGP
jgi:hypothetical protein